MQQYVDRDPSLGHFDFTCGPLSYEGHKGTDFALHSLRHMSEGVDVLAAAGGIVTGLRDGEPDSGIAGMSEGRDCGNGIVLSHEAGWQTQYCHLAKGSITVSKGQRVAQGQPLGQVGLSGRTQFPHLHLSVRQNGQVVDPFRPDASENCGTEPARQLWHVPIRYLPGSLISLDIATSVPDFEGVKAGTASASKKELTTNAPALVLVAYGYGAQAGDLLQLTLEGPNGEVIDRQIELEKTQAQYFRAFGLKKPDAGWNSGAYRGVARLSRAGRTLSEQRVGFALN